ncbi:alpha/beta fold hydrolase [Aldersonia sp. NBC_00410]|uniref:alpha/beta hydrolase n=1 Tax=Aldersonia sp. NBC_00410 TaxID=2975954 RepID=UPI002258DD4E|nr:alpha/beta fold hydrolase [Aldersonia sp. NBC_00410]MCX5043695.1 alpha/beta fold hydrolase [Aldersonia sp. NBC_00410]
MPFLDGVSGRVHYRVWTVHDPRALVVLLHGIRQSSSDYHRFGRAMGRSGIEVWAIDHVGHGLSEGAEGVAAPLADLGENAQRLIGLAAAQHGELPVFVFGHSLGAATALAALHAPAATPVSGLVLCGTPKGVTGGDVATPTLPTLVVHGVDDRLAPIDAVRSWVASDPAIELREYSDAGHDLLHEPVQARVSADVAEWILGPPLG